MTKAIGANKNKETALSPEALAIFKQKTLHSVHILPACWGGYDVNDELCQNCSVGAGTVFLENISETAKRVNEDEDPLANRGYGGPFFAVHSGSCLEERTKLDDAVRVLEEAHKIRRERQAIENITRLPKGEVREGQAPFDYVKYHGRHGLWVRLCKEENEKYPKAIGILYEHTDPYHPDEKPSFRPDRIVGYIKSIINRLGVPFAPLHSEEYSRVFIKSQSDNPDGDLILMATRTVEETTKEPEIAIVLYGDSIKTVSARFDELGRLS